MESEVRKSRVLTNSPVQTAFILYRQHHQAGVVHKYPGLANPDISKIIGEHWREENDETKNYWKRLAEEEKARHQRQYPQYKYQPRRGGKNGPAARAAAAAAGAGEDPGRCPKCGGRHISTPRTPSTPFGGIPGPGHGFGPVSASAMQPFITNNPRVIETVQQQPHHRQSAADSQHGSMGDPRLQQPSYYPAPPEPLRAIEEDYEAGFPPGMSRRRGPQQEDFDMLTSPELKRRRFDPYSDRGSPMSAVSQHRSQQQQYPLMSGQVPYPQYQMQQQQQQQHQQYPIARWSSSVSAGGSVYSNQPSGTGGGNYPTAPLPHPRTPSEAQPQQHLQQQQQQPQQQQQGRGMGMAPPPRPSQLSTAGGVPPAPPGLPAPQSSRGPNFDESLTLAPLKIPSSPAQVSAASDSTRSLSGGGPSGLGMESQQQQMLVQHGDSQARGIEAMVMSIPYTNKLEVLRKISPALNPPGVGSPGVETRGPVIAIEAGHVALMKEVRPVIERALRASGECNVRVWADSSVERGSPTPAVLVSDAGLVQKPARQGEDVQMSDIRDRLSATSGSRHSSITGTSSDGCKTPTPRHPGGGGSTATPAAGTSMLEYLQTIVEWHTKSAEIIKHITSKPNNAGDAATTTTPVALIPGGFSLTLSDRFACTAAITDPYSPVDHWQWGATLWRGIVGPDLVVYVRQMTAEEAARNSGLVESIAAGVMVVSVAGEKIDEKTERRLAFEVMEWVRAGSFQKGYSFGGRAPEG
ncbi:slightly ste11-like protein [Gnomoniopsis sp. IMI 355080]|nr:slightly ste11-like protein [Gnomoniopsis sp. IMI 355080]